MTDSEVEEDQGLQQILPTSFGRQDRVVNTSAQIEQSRRKVDGWETGTKKQRKDGSGGTASASGSSDDSDDDSDDEDEFPTSHELVLKTHERAVTTATLDPSGTRLITGSSDCTLRLHDFSSMTPTTVRAFKSVDPTTTKQSGNNETHPIHQVLFNPISPSQILVITALPQAKILSRDGEVQSTFVKGDMYLRDMHNTKGHVSEVTSGAWHPTKRDLCVTAGTDSTLRIWDVNNPRSQQDVIVYKSKASGTAGRSRMTAVAWGSPAQGGPNILVSAAHDGSLIMWSGDGPYNRPAAEISQAHARDTWTSGLDISGDGRLVISRGGEDTIKLCDTRKFKDPVNKT